MKCSEENSVKSDQSVAWVPMAKRPSKCSLQGLPWWGCKTWWCKSLFEIRIAISFFVKRPQLLFGSGDQSFTFLMAEFYQDINSTYFLFWVNVALPSGNNPLRYMLKAEFLSMS